MDVATSVTEVGVRELKNQLSEYLRMVKAGDDVIVTERGRPIARLSAIDEPTSRLAELVSSGAVRPPLKPGRRRLVDRIAAAGLVSEFVEQQRR